MVGIVRLRTKSHRVLVVSLVVSSFYHQCFCPVSFYLDVGLYYLYFAVHFSLILPFLRIRLVFIRPVQV
jgi:hypothetical protein